MDTSYKNWCLTKNKVKGLDYGIRLFQTPASPCEVFSNVNSQYLFITFCVAGFVLDLLH